MTRHLCEYKNKSNYAQIVILDTRIEKVILSQNTLQFEASLNQLLKIKSLDGDISNILSDTIPCSKLVI